MTKYFALIPAAGAGSRMQAGLPKQYRSLLGKPTLYYAAKRLCACPEIERVFVVLAPDDPFFIQHDWTSVGDKLNPIYCGGDTRAASVGNGLAAMVDDVMPNDWVLVHDAARPCLGEIELNRLISELKDDPVGGLLAIPVTDTLKRADAETRVIQTERRENLWRAQTPQMFRYQTLCDALDAISDNIATDEARAIENLGLHPKLVLGNSQNIKVTYSQDIAFAEMILTTMEKQ
jgi:2-C-methyl-D-erythritol 4-phosphate cytidylyltransferase